MTSAVTRVSALVASWSRRAGNTPIRTFSAPATPVEAPQTASPSVDSSKSLADLTDNQLLYLLNHNTISPHKLETDLGDTSRAVSLRRLYTANQLAQAPDNAKTSTDPLKAINAIPMNNFDYQHFYKSILNTNCEAVIGYVPLPVGIVGPLLLDNKEYRVPMATTEGALIASTNRGCAAIRKAGGATSVVHNDGMTRAPLVRVNSLKEAAELKAWAESPANFPAISQAFNSTSRFGKLKSVTVATAGRNVYIRFKAQTGDAMGMNMITKGTNEALLLLKKFFPTMRVMALSGNLCTDKKPSAINWVDGRGKSVSAEVRLSGYVLKSVLKTNAEAMVQLNMSKNLVGSALAGSVGGFNAHASNVVTALFLATGQDGAQNVESATCLTLMELEHNIPDVHDPKNTCGPGIVMSVTMPSVEVGTVGGGTSLPAQAACLELLGLKGSNAERPGANAETLARVVAGSVLAGELSLMSALTTNDLLNSHLKLNRKPSAPSHGHGNTHHNGAALITSTIEARLAEMKSGGSKSSTKTTTKSTSNTAASSSHSHHHHHHTHGGNIITPSGTIPGGAPAGSHPHPLHLTSHGGTSHLFSPTSPGRRYFAAPTSQTHGNRFVPQSSGWTHAIHKPAATVAPIVPSTPLSSNATDVDFDFDFPSLPVP